MLTIKDVLKLARAKHPIAALRSVVFDGQSAICASEMDWMVGVPCPQPHLSGPVVVPVDAILSHLAKSRHLVVMPDHLSNGQGLVTRFDKGDVDYDSVLSMLPRPPSGPVLSFDLELNALDRVLIAAGRQDIRHYLNGVMLDLTAGAMVGTDGHRVHVYRNRVPQVFGRELVDGVPTAKAVQLILPRDPLFWVLGSQGDSVRATIWNAKGEPVEGQEATAQVLLQGADGFVWIRKPIDGVFPDWERVVPSVARRPLWALVNPIVLADGAQALAKGMHLAAPEQIAMVCVDFGGGAVQGHGPDDVLPLGITLHSDDESVAPESLSDALRVSVNAQYLQDVADCVTGGAQWRVSHTNPEMEALLVVDGDFSGVVMPMRTLRPVAAPVAAAEPPEDEAPAEEPCPAAVAALADQLMGKARASAQKAPEKARKQPRRLVAA